MCLPNLCRFIAYSFISNQKRLTRLGQPYVFYPLIFYFIGTSTKLPLILTMDESEYFFIVPVKLPEIAFAVVSNLVILMGSVKLIVAILIDILQTRSLKMH